MGLLTRRAEIESRALVRDLPEIPNSLTKFLMSKVDIQIFNRGDPAYRTLPLHSCFSPLWTSKKVGLEMAEEIEIFKLLDWDSKSDFFETL